MKGSESMHWTEKTKLKPMNGQVKQTKIKLR